MAEFANNLCQLGVCTGGIVNFCADRLLGICLGSSMICEPRQFERKSTMDASGPTVALVL